MKKKLASSVLMITIAGLLVWTWSLINQHGATATNETSLAAPHMQPNQIHSILIATDGFIEEHAEGIKSTGVTPLSAEAAVSISVHDLTAVYIESDVFQKVDKSWLHSLYQKGTTIVGINMPISAVSFPLDGQSYVRDLPNAEDVKTVDDLPLKAGWLLLSSIDKGRFAVGERSWYYPTFEAAVDSTIELRRMSQK